MDPEDEDDMRLVRASASLLSDLVASLPKLFWKRSVENGQSKTVHRLVKIKDLEYVIKLVGS